MNNDATHEARCNGGANALASHSSAQRIWTIPYPRNPHFIGRERALAELSASLVPGEFRAHLVLGPAGVGKTQVAIQYAYTHADEYDEVLWLTADTLLHLRANLAALTGEHALSLPELADRSETDQIEAVFDWLRSHDRWLMICDDAGTVAAEALLELLTDVPSGHVLFTSRRIDWPIALADLTLERFSEDVAVQFLRARTRGWQAGSGAEALALAHELACAPLALEQAAAYIETKRVSYREYISQLRAAELPDHDQSDYRLSASPTWRVGESAIGPEARALLRLLSFYAPAELPRKQFARSVVPFREALGLIDASRAAAAPDDALELALEELASYAMITLAPGTFRCRQTPALLRAAIPAGDVPLWFGPAVRLFDAAIAREASGKPNRTALWTLQRHALALLQAAEDLGLQPMAAELFAETGALLHDKGRHHEAEPLLRSALSAHERALGTDHPALLSHVRRLADVLMAMSRSEEAEPLAERARAMHG